MATKRKTTSRAKKMANPILHVIPPSGPVESAPWKGKLESGTPEWRAMEKLIGCRVNHIEHVLVLFNAERRHMFVDEIGALTTGRILNYRASAIYANWSLISNDLSRWLYRDLSKMPELAPGRYEEIGLCIYGTALLWEGVME